MPVRNALPFLDAAIGSILDQTFGDFRFIIRDDGSTDGSTEVLHAWAEQDNRIQLFIANESAGPAGSSNWVVEQARTPLVARMDADDVAHRDRLRRQVEVMESDPDAIMVGTLWNGIDGDGRIVRGRNDWRMYRHSPFPPFPHGSIMFRREAFDRVGGYRRACEYWEDLDLTLRFGKSGKIIVLPEVLYQHRAAYTSTRLTSDTERVEEATDLMYRWMSALTNSGSYEDVLRQGPRRGARLRPDAFISIASNRLWAGQKPGALRRLLARGRLRPDRRTVAALIWAVWGEVSPATLRWMLKGLAWVRNQLSRERRAQGTPREWRGTGHTAV